MSRYILLASLLAAACAKKPDAKITTLHTMEISAGTTFQAELKYQALGKRMVALELELRNTGIDESDKVVSTVSIKGFDVEEGNTYWDGFVPPRLPQKHRIVLVIPTDIEFATATVSLKRSDDSQVLMREDLAFEAGDDGMVRAK